MNGEEEEEVEGDKNHLLCTLSKNHEQKPRNLIFFSFGKSMVKSFFSSILVLRDSFVDL
jgi:hypothetical protein